MEIIKKIRIKNEELWFFQSIVTAIEGLCILSSGKKYDRESEITIFFDSSCEEEVDSILNFFKRSKILFEV